MYIRIAVHSERYYAPKPNFHLIEWVLVPVYQRPGTFGCAQAPKERFHLLVNQFNYSKAFLAVERSRNHNSWNIKLPTFNCSIFYSLLFFYLFATNNDFINGLCYILQCGEGSYYTGSTIDLERLLEQHAAGKGANHTMKSLPVRLVYYEEFDRIDEAFYREKQIQDWSRNKKKALIQQTYDDLHFLVECHNNSHYKYQMLKPKESCEESANHISSEI